MFANRSSLRDADDRIRRSELDRRRVTGEADFGEKHWSTTEASAGLHTCRQGLALHGRLRAGLTTHLCTTQQASLLSLEMGGQRQFYLGPQVSNKIRRNELLHV